MELIYVNILNISIIDASNGSRNRQKPRLYAVYNIANCSARVLSAFTPLCVPGMTRVCLIFGIYTDYPEGVSPLWASWRSPLVSRKGVPGDRKSEGSGDYKSLSGRTGTAYEA